MRTGLLIIYLTFLIAGCKSKKAIQGNVLSQKEMQTVLWDMMRADQFLADYVLNKDTTLKKKTESIKLYQQILAINKVTKEKFERSFTFYKSHPVLLKALMDSIVNAAPEPVTDTTRYNLVKDSLKTTVDSATAKDTTRIFKKIKRLKPN